MAKPTYAPSDHGWVATGTGSSHMVVPVAGPVTAHSAVQKRPASQSLREIAFEAAVRAVTMPPTRSGS